MEYDGSDVPDEEYNLRSGDNYSSDFKLPLTTTVDTMNKYLFLQLQESYDIICSELYLYLSIFSALVSIGLNKYFSSINEKRSGFYMSKMTIITVAFMYLYFGPTKLHKAIVHNAMKSLAES